MIFAVTKLYNVDIYCITSKSSLMDTNINISKKLIIYWTNSIYKLDYQCKIAVRMDLCSKSEFSHQCLSKQSNALVSIGECCFMQRSPAFLVLKDPMC